MKIELQEPPSPPQEGGSKLSGKLWEEVTSVIWK